MEPRQVRSPHGGILKAAYTTPRPRRPASGQGNPLLEYAGPQDDDTGAARRIPVIVWISAGIMVVPMGLAVIFAGFEFLWPPNGGGGLGRIFASPIEIAFMAVGTLVLTMEYFALRYRSRLAAGFVLAFLGLGACGSLRIPLGPTLAFGNLWLSLGLIALVLFALAGHILWFVRVLRR